MKRRKNSTDPYTLSELINVLGRLDIMTVPITALQEIVTWDRIQKSPFSYSFYNKEKAWDITHHETIRISDHWNFFARDKIHCESDPFVDPNTNKWAKGIYNSETGKFKLIEYYEPNRDKILFNRLLEEIKEPLKLKAKIIKERNLEDRLPNHIIQMRNFTNLIKAGKVHYRYNNELCLIKKFKMEFIIIDVNGVLTKVKNYANVGKMFVGNDPISVPNINRI